MEAVSVKQLYNLEETIAADLFAGVVHPWEVLGRIHDFIIELGNSLPEELFERKGENIWVAKSASIAPTACLNGPLIVDEEAEIRHCAYIRGNAIVGKGAVVGNSTELNYVGDSILGYRDHMGAGSITSNVKSDKTLVTVAAGAERIPTGLKKMGAMLGDFVEVGCNSVLNPGVVVGKNSNIYPTSSVRGFVPADSIFKKNGEIVLKRQ